MKKGEKSINGARVYDEKAKNSRVKVKFIKNSNKIHSKEKNKRSYFKKIYEKEKGERRRRGKYKIFKRCFSSSTDHIFDIKSIEDQDGKRVVKIECYIIREEDFEKAKVIQDFLKADKVSF